MKFILSRLKDRFDTTAVVDSITEASTKPELSK